MLLCPEERRARLGVKAKPKVGTQVRAHEVRSVAPISLNQWHAVAGRFRAGQLELVVDGVAAPTAVVPGSEVFAYSGGSAELVIGDGYVGGMKSFNWYDWSAPQLVTFNDGSTNTRVTFDSTGQVVVPIRSAGQLNQHQAHAALSTMRVATTVTPVGGALPSGFVTEQRQFISLLSVDGYYDIASAIAESPSLYNGLPALGPIQFTSVQRPWLRGMVPVAHAQVTASGIWAIAVELSTWIIPWNDAVEFGKQVYKLITGADDFSWSELALSAIGVLSIVPILKPLKPATKVLRKVLALTRGSRFVTHLASALKKAVDLIVSKRGQAVLDIAPFLILVAELAATQEGRDSVMFMINSVASSDDLFAWVSYFNLPVGGWTEGTEPPAVGLLAANDTMAMNDNGVMFAGLAGVVPVAHAAGTGRAARVGRALLQRAIKAAQEGLAEAGGNPADFTRFLRTVARSHGITTSDVTKILRDPNYIKMQMRLLLQKGEAATKRALRDDPDDRITVKEIAGISAYLAAEAVAGHLRFEGQAQTLAATEATLATALAACFVGLQNNIHGARFEYMMLAELQLIGQVGDSRVAGFQVTVPVKLFQNKETRQAGRPTLSTYDRRVDLVTREGERETWWEVKSLRDGSERTAFPTWTLSRASGTGSRTSYHREFVADRSLLLRKADDVTEEDERAPSSVHWVFHKFSARNGVRSMDRPSVAIAAEQLCQNPNGSRDQIYGAFGKGPSAALRQCGATKNPIGIELIEESGLPIDVEHVTVQLRDMRDRLLGVLSEAAHLPVLEVPAP